MKVFVSILMLSLFGFNAVAQEYDFRVMVNSGSNKVMKDGSNSWNDLKNGATLFSGDKLDIVENGYVILIHKSGKPVELRDVGQTEIAKIAVEEDKGLSGKYLGYVLSRMEPDKVEQNRKKYASITGATERGFKPISLFMKSSSPTYGKNVVIRWSNMGANKKYKVTLENMFDDVITEIVTDVNMIELNLEDEKLQPYQLISVQVNDLNDENIDSEKYSIQRIDKEELGQYKSDLDDLVAALDPNSPMSHLIMAEFYEDHKLLLDAITCYEQALKKSNGLEYFQQAYIQFLMRNGWSDVL